MNKKGFWLMAVVFLSGFSQAQTNSGYCGDDGNEAHVQWSIQNDTTLIISGSGRMKNYEDSIRYIEGSKSVSTNAPWFEEYNNSITTVEIQSGVTNIGDAAFAGLSKLQSVSISDSVTSLGELAFVETAISSITLPRITNIGRYAFQNCNDIHITILNPEPPTIPDEEEDIDGGYLGGLSLIFAGDAYEEVPDGVTIYVPAEAVGTYEDNAIWGSGSVEIRAIIFTLNGEKDRELYVGDSDTLTVTVDHHATDRKVNWESGNAGIQLTPLNDTSCIMTGLLAGRTVVKAKTTDGNIADSCLITVSKRPQVITNFSDSTKTYGDPAFVLTAISSSGMPVSYESDNLAVASISGDTVTITGAGSATITATQGGDAVYLAATASISLSVGKADQSITGFLPADTAVLLSAHINLTAISSSGLPVSYERSNPATATIEDNLITAVGLGTTVITAGQAGNNNYNPAPALTCMLTVNPVPVTGVSLNKHESNLYAGDSDTLTVTVSPPDATDRKVKWESGNARIQLTPLNDTSCIMTGLLAGMAWIKATSNYDNGIADSCLVTVSKKSQSISGFTNITKTYGDVPFLLGAIATSGLSITYASSNPDVASISGNTVTITGAGSATITATQDGNLIYLAATASISLSVGKATLTVTPDTGQRKTYGEADPAEFTYQCSGWKYDDNESLLSGSLSRDGGEDAGEYNFTQGDLGAGNNYDIVIASGVKFIIDKADLTVTPAAGQRKTYGEADPAEFTYQCSGWKYDDNESLLSGSLSRDEGEDAGEYNITEGNLSAGNYDIQFTANVKFTIGKADQSITGFLPADTAILLGEEINLSAISSSGLDVNYESSNLDTATVNGNLITAVGLGTTVITANQAGNNNYNPAPALTCTLTVNPVPVTGVSLNEHTLELRIGDSETLTATVSPPDATTKSVRWSSNDESVATVDNDGLVSAVGEGSAWITATSNYDNGIADSCLVTVTVATGISTVDESLSVTVGFSDETLYIDSPAAEQIAIYSISGKLLDRASKPAGTASFAIPNSERILIVGGSSGWVKKIEDR